MLVLSCLSNVNCGFVCVGSVFISFSGMKMLIYFHLIIASVFMRIAVNILILF